jgi:hypothetical protein
MDILKESKIKVEGKSELEAKMKAKKLILKKHPLKSVKIGRF